MMFLGELRLSPSTLSSPMQHGRVNHHKVAVNLDQFMLAHYNYRAKSVEKTNSYAMFYRSHD